MNERNPYQQYGYDNYDQPPQAAQLETQGGENKSLAARVPMKFKNPLFATAALLLSESAFAAIVVMSYPGDSDTQNDVPVVKADKMAFKTAPDDAGGMDIPFQDSTVFSSLRDGELQESAPIVQESAPVVQETVPVADPVAAVQKEDMSGLSIAQLAERLETGLEKLRQLEIAHRTGVVPAQTATHAPAGGPPAGFAEAPLNVPPLKPVEQTEEDPQAARQADMDAALKAALGTLEKMTAQR